MSKIRKPTVELASETVRPSKIRRDPNVQVVIDMDGFGAPSLKRSTWRIVVQRDPVQYTGFKLFFKNDKPMMTMQQVIELYPSPVYVQYQ